MEKPFLRRFTKNIFIVSNCMIAIFFLAGAYVKYFNPANGGSLAYSPSFLRTSCWHSSYFFYFGYLKNLFGASFL